MIIFILAPPSCVFTQNSVLGKIYGKKGVVRYIKVLNITQGIITFSDEEGNFEINAIENDSISFSSSFYETKKIIVNKTHLNEIYVFHLKEKINELDEVVVRSEPKFKEFDIEEFNLELRNQIKEDIKKNPHKYGAGAYENIVINKVISFIGRLLKKKEEEYIKTITYEEFETLFKRDTFFNEAFLRKELKIPKDYKYLFFDFCEAKKIDSKKLEAKNNFLLLDDLMRASNEFISIIEGNEDKP